MLKILPLIATAAVLWADYAAAAVNVAVIAPRVGELKIFGDEIISGAQIAVNDINANGGINGQRVNLVVVDDRCDDKLAVSTAQMMAVNSSPEDRMALVIGPYCDNQFARVADIYAKANIFQIIPTTISKSDAGFSKKGLVKMVGSTEREGRDFFTYYQNNFGGLPVALVYDGNLRKVVEVAAAVQNEFRSHNKTALLKTYNAGNYGKSPAGLARDVAGQGNRLVYLLGEAEKTAELARKIKGENPDMVIFTNRYQAGDSMREELGELAEGSYQIALPSLKNDPDFTETLVRLRLQGEEPEGLGVYSFTAMKLWRELAGKAGSFQYERLARALDGYKFETAWGEVMFTNGNPAQSINYGVYKLQDGEYTQVY